MPVHPAPYVAQYRECTITSKVSSAEFFARNVPELAFGNVLATFRAFVINFGSLECAHSFSKVDTFQHKSVRIGQGSRSSSDCVTTRVKHKLAYCSSRKLYYLYHIHFTAFSSYNGYKLNSHVTCFRPGFIAQPVENRTGVAEAMGSNPIGASIFYLGFIRNCLSYFITAKIFSLLNLFHVNRTYHQVQL